MLRIDNIPMKKPLEKAAFFWGLKNNGSFTVFFFDGYKPCIFR